MAHAALDDSLLPKDVGSNGSRHRWRVWPLASCLLGCALGVAILHQLRMRHVVHHSGRLVTAYAPTQLAAEGHVSDVDNGHSTPSPVAHEQWWFDMQQRWASVSPTLRWCFPKWCLCGIALFFFVQDDQPAGPPFFFVLAVFGATSVVMAVLLLYITLAFGMTMMGTILVLGMTMMGTVMTMMRTVMTMMGTVKGWFTVCFTIQAVCGAVYFCFNEVTDDLLAIDAHYAVIAISCLAAILLLLGYDNVANFDVGCFLFATYYLTWMTVFVVSRFKTSKTYTFFRVVDCVCWPVLFTSLFMVGSSIILHSDGFTDRSKTLCVASPCLIPMSTPKLEDAKAVGLWLAQCFLDSLVSALMRVTMQQPLWAYSIIGGIMGALAGHKFCQKLVASGQKMIIMSFSVVGVGTLTGVMYLTHNMWETFGNMRTPPPLFPVWHSLHPLSHTQSWERTSFFLPVLLAQIVGLLVIVGSLHTLFMLISSCAGLCGCRKCRHGGRQDTWLLVVFVSYHLTHNLLIVLLMYWGLQNALITLTTGIDWELWVIWFTWLATVMILTCIFKYLTNFGRMLPGPVLSVSQQFMPGIGNDLHLIKDWVFVANCIRIANCTSGCLRFAGYSLALVSSIAVFFPMTTLFDSAAVGEAFIAAHWPVVADVPVDTDKADQVDDDDDAEQKFARFVVGVAVKQTTQAKFLTTAMNELPQVIATANFVLIFGGSQFVWVSLAMSLTKVSIIPVVREMLPELLQQFGTVESLECYARQTLQDPSPALHIPVSWNEENGVKGVEVCLQLLRKGNNGVDVKDGKGRTPLTIAVSKPANKKVAEMLLENKASMHAAISCLRGEKWEYAVLQLLESKSEVNAADEQGRTLLMLASSFGCSDIVNALLDRKANISLRTSHGKSALKFAFDLASKSVDEKNWQTAECLKRAAGVEHALSELNVEMSMALERHIERGNLEMVRKLLDFSVSPNAKNSENVSAIMLAQKYREPSGEPQIVTLLLARKADADAQSDSRKADPVHARRAAWQFPWARQK